MHKPAINKLGSDSYARSLQLSWRLSARISPSLLLFTLIIINLLRRRKNCIFNTFQIHNKVVQQCLRCPTVQHRSRVRYSLDNKAMIAQLLLQMKHRSLHNHHMPYLLERTKATWLSSGRINPHHIVSLKQYCFDESKYNCNVSY
jgi:hypothetical protein